MSSKKRNGRSLDVQGLGLRSFERKRRIKTLSESVADCPDEFVILVGDFNLWFPASRSLPFSYPSREL